MKVSIYLPGQDALIVESRGSCCYRVEALDFSSKQIKMTQRRLATSVTLTLSSPQDKIMSSLDVAQIV